MKPGLPNLPALKSQSGAVDAACYNRVRLALSRLGGPQELVLGERGLSVRLERSVWVCADRRLNDFPLLAWTGFDRAGRTGLHVPIRCQLIYYHAFAEVVGGAVLAEVGRRLRDMLREADFTRRGSQVLRLSAYR